MFYVLCIILAALVGSGAHAEPRIPRSPAEVIAHLPQRPAILRADRNSSPGADTVEDSLEQVTQLMAQAHRTGDPRYMGYAEAVLGRIAQKPPLPDEVLLLQARIHQFNHRFGNALIDLTQILQHDPHHPQALLLQASIYQVRGEYALARQGCQRIRSLANLSLALICEAQVDAMNGRAKPAEKTLASLLTVADSLAPDQKVWFFLGYGDLLLRLGEVRRAEQLYRRLPVQDPAVRAALADVLLRQHRPAEVMTLLEGDRQQDGLLLRLGLAEKALGLASAGQTIAALDARFKALRLRGEVSHLREEAIFALYLKNDRSKALALARANWLQQRETPDFEVYWQAALANDSESDRAVLKKWMLGSGFQDDSLLSGHAARQEGAS
ncbi:Tfp pilus assembly protein PilF [Fluviicoccus keumensis]|uniref:Tfp pilus assembly protein PilF n=1 Tax=Fluviicoccus keumensis TaxID=1435465 RepID=A0A4Q7ZBD3_9GAMM|nr:hypothetical protein [Fluviicoccus keumensis]RZU47245.1 Tfp pilus assembly protein PilF [Fluviicoccus keumensis]